MSIRKIRNIGFFVGLMLGVMAAVSNPATAQDSTPAATPGVEQPVVIGDVEITWTGDWQYDSASSIEQQATFIQIDMENQVLKLVSYGSFEDETVEGTGEAIDVFAQSYFESAGAEAVDESGTGELEDGAIWRLYSFELEGVPVTFLISAEQDDEGAFVLTTLTANTSAFAESLTQVREEFTLNEDGQLFEELDEAEVIETIPAQASPEATPAA